jgi:hypothetical protein
MKVLVSAASKYGATGEIAQAVGDGDHRPDVLSFTLCDPLRS